MRKKIVASMLILALMLSFAACSASANIRGEISANDPTEGKNNATTQPQENTEAPTEPEFSIGTSSGNTYINRFIGIQCTLGSDWAFKTDEEMKQTNQAAADMVADEYKDLLASLAVVQDMMAVNANQMDTVNVVLEKLSGAALLLTEEQYMSQAKDSAVNALASMGLTIVSAEQTKIQFAGEEHAALTIEADVGGYAMYETMVVIKCSGYIACITACTWTQNTCMDILNQFVPC